MNRDYVLQFNYLYLHKSQFFYNFEVKWIFVERKNASNTSNICNTHIFKHLAKLPQQRPATTSNNKGYDSNKTTTQQQM